MKYLKGREMYNVLTRLPVDARGRIMGFNASEKYVGVVVSDNCHRVASPISFWNREELGVAGVVEEVQKKVAKYRPSAFVVGWPMVHQRPTPEAIHVQSFVDELCQSEKFNDVYYTKWWQAYPYLQTKFLFKQLELDYKTAMGMHGMFSAVEILQDYLDAVYMMR